MKKLFLIFLLPFFFNSCDDDDKDVDTTTEVYKGEALKLNVSGVGDELENVSVVLTLYPTNTATVAVNNLIEAETSVIVKNVVLKDLDGARTFTIETEKKKDETLVYKAVLSGSIKDNVCALTGNVDYPVADE